MTEKELSELGRNWLNSIFTSKMYGPAHPTVRSLTWLLMLVEQRKTWNEDQLNDGRKDKNWLRPATPTQETKS